jgi:hypothetical protein
MTDDCCFGEDLDEIGDEIRDLQAASVLDQEYIARLESIADRLAAGAMALVWIVTDRQRSVLSIAEALQDAQEALDDLQRYGEERERAVGFPEQPRARSEIA